ncbi:Cytochrome P450 [Corchorus olitorius]|uniref:Cytochrome P450 n=1 Tax=Corchorus olitorius TaxID=93759 RepID=A0A1R3KA86_9ROSI|nr:Cytochrome P450 [Corchorus olitorius]
MADFQGYLILFLIWLVSVIFVRTIISKTRSKSCLPPSPMALPIIGHLHLLAPIPHQSLHKLSTKYGPLMHILLGSVPCVVASSPEMAKEFLKTYESSFSNRPKTAAVDYLTYGSADFSFAPYGPYWKFMKKICMSELLSGRMLDQFLPVRREEIRQFLQFMMRKVNASEKVDVGGELVRLTNNVVSRMIMNQICSNDDDEAEEVRKLVQAIAELTGKFNLSDYIWFCKNLDLQGMKKKLKQVRDKFDTMMDRIIKEHEEARKRKEDGGDTVKDLLDILLDISADENSEMKLTRENIKAFILLDVRGQHFHLLPFGSGRRSCPGTTLALQVVQTSLAAMIQCFDWKVDGANGTVDMKEGPGLTLPRAHPLICTPVPRLNPFPSF